MAKITILEPVAAFRTQAVVSVSKPKTLVGGTLGLLSNGWRSFNTLLEIFKELAVNKYGIARVVHRINSSASAASPPEYYEAVARCDAVIAGLAH